MVREQFALYAQVCFADERWVSVRVWLETPRSYLQWKFPKISMPHTLWGIAEWSG